MRSKLLYISGAIAWAFALFHCFFWVLFDWGIELPKLSAVNSGIIQVSNVIFIFIFLYQGFISFSLARKRDAFSFVEKSILVFIAGFYFLRAALGFPMFGVDLAEVVVILVCLVIIAADLLALKLPAATVPARSVS